MATLANETTESRLSRRLVELRTDAVGVDPLEVCRDCPLPRSRGVLESLEVLRGHYIARTGRELPWELAAHILDCLNREREQPIPIDLSPIACWLIQHGYDRNAILFAVRDIRLGGSLDGNPHLDREDLPYVAEILASIRNGGHA